VELGKVASAMLLLPGLAWSVNGIRALAENGLYSYSFLFPLPVKFHTVSVLNISIFYVAVFLAITPHKPLRNSTIPCSLLFLSNAVYELVYGIFLNWKSLTVTLPLSLGGIALVLFLNRRFHFLTNDTKRITPLALCLVGLIAIMISLNEAGFFAEMRLYLSGLTAKDPHDHLWILSKTLSVWMFFPVLVPGQGLRRRPQPTSDSDHIRSLASFEASQNLPEAWLPQTSRRHLAPD